LNNDQPFTLWSPRCWISEIQSPTMTQIFI
jgi:hypothetical protein